MYLFVKDADELTVKRINDVNAEITKRVNEINSSPNKSILIKSRKFLAGGTLESNNCFIVTDDIPPNDEKDMLHKKVTILPMSAWEDIDVPVVESIACMLPTHLLIWWQSLESIQSLN